MNVTPALLKINFHEGRTGPHPIDCVVIHVTEGDAGSVVSWFNNPEAQVSAHYLVTTAGTVLQFVNEDDVAWHAGRVDHPSAALVIERAGTNPNNWTIGIEHEGDGKHEMTPFQRGASIELIVDICKRHNIPIDRKHIVGHHEIYRPKTCPGAISVDRLVGEVRTAATLASEKPKRPAAPKLVYSDYLGDWLIVTREASDTDWSYVRFGSLKESISRRAVVPLSTMPTP